MNSKYIFYLLPSSQRVYPRDVFVYLTRKYIKIYEFITRESSI